jgi:hypothetical protein
MHVLDKIDEYVEHAVDLVSHSVALTNRTFLNEYGSYVDPEWKSHYICYDLLQLNYKEIKHAQKKAPTRRFSNRTRTLKLIGSPKQANGKPNTFNSPVSPSSNDGTGKDGSNKVPVGNTASLENPASVHEISVSQAVVYFDNKFREEIKKSFDFMFSQLVNVDSDLSLIEEEFDALTPEEREDLLEKNEITKSSYRNIRSLFMRLERLKTFYRLNQFAINKTGKKFDKIVSNLPAVVGNEVMVAELAAASTPPSSPSNGNNNSISSNSNNRTADSSAGARSTDNKPNLAIVPPLLPLTTATALTWECFNSAAELAVSNPLYNSQFDETRAKCVRIYAKIFRRTHEHIAEGELRFFKSKEGGSRALPYYIGYKIGFICALVSGSCSASATVLLFV